MPDNKPTPDWYYVEMTNIEYEEVLRQAHVDAAYAMRNRAAEICRTRIDLLRDLLAKLDRDDKLAHQSFAHLREAEDILAAIERLDTVETVVPV